MEFLGKPGPRWALATRELSGESNIPRRLLGCPGTGRWAEAEQGHREAWQPRTGKCPVHDPWHMCAGEPLGRGRGTGGLERRFKQTCAFLASPPACFYPGRFSLQAGAALDTEAAHASLRHPGATQQYWKGWRGIGSGEGPIEQIVPTAAESQRIVAARPLCRLQYRVESKSSAWDLPQ